MIECSTLKWTIVEKNNNKIVKKNNPQKDNEKDMVKCSALFKFLSHVRFN